MLNNSRVSAAAGEMNMNSKLEKVRRQAKRAIQLAPEFVLNPSHLREAIRGVHPGSLTSLDQEWLKAIGFDVILDVGANTGQFARAAHTVFPNARIYSFEPLPDCLTAMGERMKGISGFQAFGSAIGNEDGTITIHHNTSSPSSSILPMTREHTEAFPWTEGDTDIEVEIHRLDHFLPQLDLSGNILLKIDVQGFSQQVLLGAPEALSRSRAVFIETSFVQLYEGEATFDTTYRFMIDRGFEFVGFLDQLEHPKSGRILQGDAIFLKAGGAPSSARDARTTAHITA